MAVLTIKISDAEMSWLDSIAKTQRRTKTEIVRSALRPVFEDNFIDERPIIVSEEEFNAVVDMLNQPLSQEEIEGRNRLASAKMWELP